MPSVTTTNDPQLLRLVVDTNLWIRALLGGRRTLPLLQAWHANRFIVLGSRALLEELEQVWQRPRLKQRITSETQGYCWNNSGNAAL